MSFSYVLYPAVGSSCTQLLGSIVPCPLGRPLPIRWVQLYFFAGYDWSYSLGIKHSIQSFTTFRQSLRCRFLEGDTLNGQSQGLLQYSKSETVVTIVGVHEDASMIEVQGTCGVTIPRVSTRRPIVAIASNAIQLTIEVSTQDGQVEIITCIGCRRDTRMETTTTVVVSLPCCT